MAERSPHARRLLHLGFGLPAFVLPWLEWRFALLVALFAALMNFELLPRLTLTRPLFREDERRLGGIVLYPLTVALLILIFRDRLEVAALAWIVLAAGDPAASLFGAGASRRWPCNPAKSPRGTLAFFLSALVFGLAFVLLHHDLGISAGTTLVLAAGFGALAEASPWPRDDNLLVGLAAALGALLGGAIT